MNFDKRRKYYLILDCETATLPFANEYEGQIGLLKPLIYDIGWQVVDRKGRVYKKVSYIVSEIFFNLNVFNTAYYAEKRPLYFNDIQNGKAIVSSWEQIARELKADLDNCELCGAYNSFFDFKKAIPFTEQYMIALYSNDIDNFYKRQRYALDRIAEGNAHNPYYDNKHFCFRGDKYKVFDIWFMACKNLINSDHYKDFCLDNGYYNKYFKTSAEVVYRYFTENDFAEEHRALQDAEIETEIFALSVNKTKEIEQGIVAFPFRTLGTVSKYAKEKENS